ncbi:MAG: hypothetical protein U0228_24110 [Myxococcaceae bacterium]
MSELRACLVVALISATIATAKPKDKKAPPPPLPPPASAPVTPSPPAPVANDVQLDPAATPASLVAQLNQLYESLEYERVLPFAEACLQRSDLPLTDQLEVYRLLGSAKAIVEDPVDAEKPFRLLLRARPEYDLPAATPPKILAVFRKVQTEERALAGKLREVERERVIASLKLLDELPGETRGGRPLRFSLRLRDPGSAVETVKVAYRRAGEKAYSTLALQRGEEGDWRGAIPGDFTATSSGFPLEYYVETADRAGPLLTVGAERLPKTIAVAPGLVETRFKPIHPAVTVTTLVLTALAGLAAGAFALSFNLAQADYRRYTANGATVAGSELVARARTGQTLAYGVDASLVALGVGVVANAILLPLTDFDPAPK